MPDRLLWTPLRPSQLFARLQLPFLAGILVIPTIALLAIGLVAHSGLLLTGMAIAAAASCLFLVPGRAWYLSGWIIVVPLLDVLALALVRTALLPYLPTIGMLCLFPFAWIAYRFRWPGLLAVLAGGVFIAALPFLLGQPVVNTPLAALNVLTLPAIATGISVGIHWGANSFRRGREKVRQATQDLHRALERVQDDQLVLRSLIDTLSPAVAFYDADNRLALANAAAEKLVRTAGFRLDTPPYAGEGVLRADRTTVIPLDEQLVPRALRGEIIANHIEWLGPEGDQTAIMASSRRVHRDDGLLLGTVIVANDVTDLANAIEIREQFLTTVSHELRTPLTSIIGFTDEVIVELGDRARELGVDIYLETIARNANTLLDRVGLLLAAADKQIDLSPEKTDLAELIAQTTDPLRRLAQGAGVTIRSDLPATLPVEVDRARMVQAVENLLTNAIKFTGRGGTVSVSAAARGEHAVITVADSGIGMTADEQRRVFDRFYRSKAVRENAIQGIGVGLSIVKSIVDAHRGEISVESEPGRGTTFEISVPLRLSHRP